MTGATRAHWEAAADRLLDAVTPYATDGFAQYRLPGRPGIAGPGSDGLEGYARTFLLAAFRIAGARGDVPPALLERYAAGLVAGTDPAHPYAWPPLTDMSQPLVEAASIALALHETRPWLYDRLTGAQQERVVHWLSGMIGARTPPNNWILFQAVVEQFLADAGGPHEPGEITGALDRIEDWYHGDGWYSDGAGQCFDYYSGWAMHLYPVLWARMSGDTDRARRYAGRLHTFLDQYQHLFADNGAPVHQGRSLTYRFATVAPLWLGALVGATPLSPGTTSRITGAALRYFADRGAPDERGLLPLGWHGAFAPVVQPYSGPASPYWASKAFLGLLLPAGHPVWTAPGQPPAGDVVQAMPAPGWLVQSTRSDGVVRLINHGSDRARKARPGVPPDPLYLRLAYSSHTGPQMDEASHTDPVDNHVAVLAPDGTVALRRRISRVMIADGCAASSYEDVLPTGAVRVVVASVVHGPLEARIVQVTAPPGHRVRAGGYALAGSRPPAVEAEGAAVVVSRPDGLRSAVHGLHGFSGAAAREAVGADAFGEHSATPYLIGEHPGGTRWYVLLVALTSGPVRSCSAQVGTGVTLRWHDGEQATVTLDPAPSFQRRPAAPTAER
ncbi:DUF2264 domain-containing protein [Actinoplanes xinjiangensis]|uniref:DUF2264 domain-containing protein n=1 Tax=Actinoplanes xinjiangensis TaxID=512350 RepID=A0A316FAD7_9ACTN|nr:DUF2264 domain-containing protein [Actinoplanes xinjiangensis]PWK43487.1 hypothetical protein BC793_113169 [Actinoplanes xinjiangensis]GIF41803.1 hypothetical protein Axi01nite_61140 [Actinoplanes xinjiangensis]